MQGYPIMNSISGLESCSGKLIDICDECGFCMAGEMHCVMRLQPDTIMSELKLRI